MEKMEKPCFDLNREVNESMTSAVIGEWPDGWLLNTQSERPILGSSSMWRRLGISRAERRLYASLRRP